MVSKPDSVSQKNSPENHLIMSSSSSLPTSVVTTTKTIPDYLDFNSEELFNSKEGLVPRPAAPQTHFNPDFLEFFPGLREFTAQMQPLFASNAPQSRSYNLPASPPYHFTSNNSPSHISTGSPLWNLSTNSSVYESPPLRSASSPYRLASPPYRSPNPHYGPTSPSYGYASPTYLPDSPSHSSQPYRPVPPMTFLNSSPQHQSLSQSYPSPPSPPPSGRSSPCDRNIPTSSFSHGRLGFGEAQNIPTLIASQESGSESQEFAEITNMDSFARYLLGITPAPEESGSIFCGKANLSLKVSEATPVRRSEDVPSYGFSTVSQDTQGIFLFQSPPDHPVSSPSQKSPKPRAPQAVRGCPSKQVCSQCGTGETSLWRRDASGKPLCNACKLYFKVHGTARPQSWRRDVTQRRCRGKAGLKQAQQ